MKTEDRERIEKEAKPWADFGHRSHSAYIAGAIAEQEHQQEIIQKLMDELIYESGSSPGTFFMWGRTGGSKPPDWLMNIKLDLESLKIK